MKISLSFLLFAFALPAILTAEESPGLTALHSGEVVSSARCAYKRNFPTGARYQALDIGIDDTLDTFRADLSSRYPGLPLDGNGNHAYNRIDAVDNGDGITAIRIYHYGRIGVRAPDGPGYANEFEIDFQSYSQLRFSPYRISGNTSAVSLTVNCVVPSARFDSPDANGARPSLSLSAGCYVSDSVAHSEIVNLSGTIEYDADNGPPRGYLDLHDNFGFTDQDGGDYLVATNTSDSQTVGYLGKFDCVNSVYCRLEGGDFITENPGPWIIDLTTPLVFQITSSDPDVRFLLEDKENPAPKPDLRIGRGSTALKGDNLYQNKPSRQQTAKIKQGKRKRKSFALRLENDGPDVTGGHGDNAIRVHAPKKRKGLKLSYYETSSTGKRNVTAAFTSGRYTLPAHFPGYGEQFEVLSKARKRASRSKKKVAKVNIVSSQSAAGGVDVVRAAIVTK